MSDYQNPYQPSQPPPQQQPTYTIPASDGGSGVKMAILFGAVLALIAANVYLFLQIDGLKQQMAQGQQVLVDELGKVRETNTVSAAAARQKVDSLRDELEAARRQQQMAVGQAKVDATRHAEDLARKLEQQQRAVEQAVRSEIKEVEQTASNRIGEVSTEVNTVRTEVSNTKGELDRTIASLKSVAGDLGVQSGLIATNSTELSALKALGERNYFEFNLTKTKQPQRVGDILVQLKKADQKRNRYTVEVIADDKKTEKKDRNINEPVQFYTSKARQPYEIVVNTVGKDRIQGYLATPKVQIAR
ncbi:MAG: hypothetical protein KJZ79_18350 [Bryobacteraceae bacterium]|nr:hypothetical protein [Bryobacteraceae bacterium]